MQTLKRQADECVVERGASVLAKHTVLPSPHQHQQPWIRQQQVLYLGRPSPWYERAGNPAFLYYGRSSLQVVLVTANPALWLMEDGILQCTDGTCWCSSKKITELVQTIHLTGFCTQVAPRPWASLIQLPSRAFHLSQWSEVRGFQMNHPPH